MKLTLTRKQWEIFDFLIQNQDNFRHPPTLEELCASLGVSSRGSLHAHIKALIEAKLIEAPERKQRGIRLTDYARQLIGDSGDENGLPFVGTIAALTKACISMPLPRLGFLPKATAVSQKSRRLNWLMNGCLRCVKLSATLRARRSALATALVAFGHIRPLCVGISG